MLIASTADWHLRGKDLEAADQQIGALVKACIERGVDLLTVAGDIFERPNICDQQSSVGALAEVAHSHFLRFTTSIKRPEIIMIPGNHDIAGVGSKDALHVFDAIDGVTVIRKPSWFSWTRDMDERFGGRCVLIGCLPWQWSGDARAILKALIAEMPDRVIKADILNRIQPTLFLGHVEIVGGLMNNAKTCEPKPGKWQLSRNDITAIPVDHVSFGHFHKRIPPFVGALRQTDFGEQGNPAGFEIWNTENGEVDWIELDAAPRYFTINAHTEEFRAGVFSGRDGVTPRGKVGCREIDQVKIRIEGDMGNVNPDLIAGLERSGVEVEQVIERQERVRRANVEPGILDDPHGLIALFAENQEPKIEGAQLERMLRVFDELFADKQEEVEGAENKPVDEGGPCSF